MMMRFFVPVIMISKGRILNKECVCWSLSPRGFVLYTRAVGMRDLRFAFTPRYEPVCLAREMVQPVLLVASNVASEQDEPVHPIDCK